MVRLSELRTPVDEAVHHEARAQGGVASADGEEEAGHLLGARRHGGELREVVGDGIVEELVETGDVLDVSVPLEGARCAGASD